MCLNQLHDVNYDCGSFRLRFVLDAGKRMSGINRISKIEVIAVVMYNSLVNVAIFIDCNEWYAVELRTTKELTYHVRCQPGPQSSGIQPLSPLPR